MPMVLHDPYIHKKKYKQLATKLYKIHINNNVIFYLRIIKRHDIMRMEDQRSSTF